MKIISLSIKSPGRPDVCLAIPETGTPKGTWFTLKEGSRYSLDFTFQVSNNIVSGLKYTNTVWKTGIKGTSYHIHTPFSFIFIFIFIFIFQTLIAYTVDSTKQMIGTFSPQLEPYTHEMPEETTPSGMFARGSYTARSKVYTHMLYIYIDIDIYRHSN